MARARALDEVRRSFASKGFLEVDTPIVTASALSHPDVEPLTVQVRAAAQVGQRFLRTSPEAAMKRLLASEVGPIFEIGKCFRDGDLDKTHNPEFTMLEWYRPGESYLRILADAEELLRGVFGLGPATQVSYDEAFESIGVELRGTSDDDLRALLSKHGVAIRPNVPRGLLRDALFKARIEPRLGHAGPVFVVGFPSDDPCLAALAADGVHSERYEVFAGGMEVGNGCAEERDPEILRQRLLAENELRGALGLQELAPDEDLLSAVANLPACSGGALGFDRLLMLSRNEDQVGNVLPFAFTRA